MTRVWVIAFVIVSGCWREGSVSTTPRASGPPSDTSYRATTIALDAIGVAAIASGMAAYHAHGLDSVAGHVLVATGGLTGAFGAPIAHAAHGHTSRAVAGYLMRSMFATIGTFAAMANGCADNRVAGCEITPNLWWGIAGGIAVGGALDALILHGTGSPWTPTVTPSDRGARVGLTRAF